MARPRETTEYLTNQQNEHIWWSNLPIKVYFDEESLNIDEIVLAQTAFHIWNGAIGEEVFELDYSSYNNTSFAALMDTGQSIYITKKHLRRYNGIQRLGTCKWHFHINRFGDDVAIQSATITLHDEILWEEIIFIVMHEVGHALGLMHDTSKRSIMYRAPMGSTLEIEQNDLEFIRNQIALLRMKQRGFREVYGR